MWGIEVEGIKRRHLDIDAWREMLQRFAAGGESVTAFCRREGVSTNSFRRWRARLEATSSMPASHAAPGFVEVGSLGGAAAAAARLELTLDLGGGVTLHVVRG